MEHKFKIGELVKVVENYYTCPNHEEAANAMGLINWTKHAGAWSGDVHVGDTAIVVGFYGTPGTFIGIRMSASGKSYVAGSNGLESLDNPPKPKKQLTHMAVFRAIHAGYLVKNPCPTDSRNLRLQNYWTEGNRLDKIASFTKMDGTTTTIEEVVERFGE